MRNLILLLIVGFLASPTVSTGQVLINEIDYDQVGADAAEFVELYNPGIVSVDLSTFTLELVNGSGGGAVIDESIALTGSVAAGGYYVICQDVLTVPNCDQESISSFQNGAPDAVGLRNVDMTLIDAVSYEGDTGAPYTEGTGTTASDSNSLDLVGLSRSPGSIDTNNNDADFTLRCITPGEINTLVDTACDTLPVELGDVGILMDGGDVVLAWNTLSESELNGFEIQRKTTSEFSTIGFVAAANEPSAYSFRIEGEAPSAAVYRLRVLNRDGSSTYSQEVETAIDLIDSHVLSNAYPNPFNPSAVFTLTVNRDQHVEIGLYDMLGRQMDAIFSGVVEADEVRQFTIRGDQLSSGMYFYRVEGEYFSDMRSIVLMK